MILICNDISKNPIIYCNILSPNVFDFLTVVLYYMYMVIVAICRLYPAQHYFKGELIMKKNVFKKILCVMSSLMIIFACAFSASAETLQDRIQAWLANRGDNSQGEQTTSSTNDSPISDEQFAEQVKQLWDQISGTDIGSVISELDLQKLFDMGEEAWKSGVDMIKDAIGGGSGTSSSDNTGTKPATTQRAAASTYVIKYDTAPPTTSSNTTSATPETTTSPSTYSVVSQTEKNERVTSAAADEKSLSPASIVVIVVLSIATIGVIVALVVYFSVKRR